MIYDTCIKYILNRIIVYHLVIQFVIWYITECPSGYYGDNCTSICPANCEFTCNHINGVCKDGKCIAGYHGEMCDQGNKFRF